MRELNFFETKYKRVPFSVVPTLSIAVIGDNSVFITQFADRPRIYVTMVLYAFGLVFLPLLTAFFSIQLVKNHVFQKGSRQKATVEREAKVLQHLTVGYQSFLLLWRVFLA